MCYAMNKIESFKFRKEDKIYMERKTLSSQQKSNSTNSVIPVKKQNSGIKTIGVGGVPDGPFIFLGLWITPGCFESVICLLYCY